DGVDRVDILITVAGPARHSGDGRLGDEQPCGEVPADAAVADEQHPGVGQPAVHRGRQPGAAVLRADEVGQVALGRQHQRQCHLRGGRAVDADRVGHRDPGREVADRVVVAGGRQDHRLERGQLAQALDERCVERRDDHHLDVVAGRFVLDVPSDDLRTLDGRQQLGEGRGDTDDSHTPTLVHPTRPTRGAGVGALVHTAAHMASSSASSRFVSHRPLATAIPAWQAGEIASVTRRPLTILILAAAAGVLGFVACSADDDERAPSAPSAGGGPTTSETTGGDDGAGTVDGTSEDPTTDETSDPTGTESPVVTPVATGFAVPWGLVPLEDGSLLVGERDTADVFRVVPGSEPVLVTTVPGVAPGGEGGLLGLAVPADSPWHGGVPDVFYAYAT